jgi:hypothetical protein
MQAPIPPSLKEFDLTEDAMARLPKQWFGEGKEGRIFVGAFIVLEIGVLIHNFPFSSLFQFFALLLGAPILGLGLIIPFVLIVNPMMISSEKKLRSLQNGDFKKACVYWAACEDYSRKKAEFDTWVRKKHEEYWRSLSGIEFENELGKLFTLMGYNVQLTPKTGDGGIDILLRKNGRLIVVQCKAHNKRIPIGVARELSASMADFHANEAIIACFEGVTKPVAE